MNKHESFYKPDIAVVRFVLLLSNISKGELIVWTLVRTTFSLVSRFLSLLLCPFQCPPLFQKGLNSTNLLKLACKHFPNLLNLESLFIGIDCSWNTFINLLFHIALLTLFTMCLSFRLLSSF